MLDLGSSPARSPLALGLSAALHGLLGVLVGVGPLLAFPQAPENDDVVVRIRTQPDLSFLVPHPARLAERSAPPRGGSRSVGLPPAPRPAPPAPGPRLPAITQPPGIPDSVPVGPASPETDPGGGGIPGGVGEGSGNGESGDGAGDGPIDIRLGGSGVIPPEPLETLAPRYPDPARILHLQGTVVLEAVIGVSGRIEDVSVARSASPVLDHAALDAVRLWRYRPARIGDRPVAVLLNVTLTFTLR